ncbi:MAG: hypothetical protein DME46_05240 [Verrucomicrobia bacterium]|nr:MAG: hypothetical protein DME46_05240 [Verrucomicrobiota bacterium]
MPNNFFAELKRRNVHKVAIAYGVVAWLLVQVAFLPAFEAPSWAIKALIVLLALGFATPEGMKRTADLSPDEVLPTWSRKKFALFIITVALLAAGLLVFNLLQ